MDLLIFIIILIILVGLSGFFSGVEVALVSVNRIKVRNLCDQKKKGSNSLLRLKENPSRMLTTILIGNNIVNVAASALATFISTEIFGYVGIGIATGIMTLFILVFGEITPKTIATTHNVRIALLVSRPIEILQKLLFPLIFFFESISDWVNKIVGDKQKPLITEEELKTIIKVGFEENVLDKKDKEIIDGVINFDDIAVRQVMTPRIKMFSLCEDVTVKEAIVRVINTRFTRIPIHSVESTDQIVGIVHIRNLIQAYLENKDLTLGKITSKPYFTSKETHINKLFSEMQKKHLHIAIVINEYGGVIGLVTLENILEEILGEIMDESDTSLQLIEKLDKYNYIAHGEMEIQELEEYLNVDLKPRGDAVTINGLLQYHLKEIPKKGSEISLNKINFLVEDVDKNLPTKIKIKVME